MAGTLLTGSRACVIGLVSLVTLLTLGCGGGNDGDRLSGSSISRTALGGSWVRDAIEYEGRSVSCPNELTINGVLVDSCAAGEVYTFNADGTYSVVYPQGRFLQLASERGRYSVSDDRLIMTRFVSGFDVNANGVIDASETTSLAPVTNPNTLPANPQQRVVWRVTLDSGQMIATPIQQPITHSSGNTVVNADGTVNASVTETTSVFVRPARR